MVKQMSTECYTFGPYKIDPKEVFYSSPLSYAMVNLRPVVPGNHAFFIVEEFVLEFGFLNIVHMCLSAQGVKLSGLLISPLMRPVICGKQHRGLVEGLSATIKRHRSLLLSNRDDRDGDLYVRGFMLFLDGPQSGQTVPHVHIHILPRREGDFERNDEIYDAIDVKEKEMQETLDLDKERKDRSPEEMSREADEYRSLFL
ncbi:hypothetical protein QUC31_018281 [Theobroma cacao]